jgi:flagellar biosynthetic protein FlhB
MALISAQLLAAVRLLAPLLLGLVGVIILANVLQSGIVFSAEPLKPDLERLNPVAGFKRFFSIRLLYELLKSLIKLSALAVVAVLALEDLLQQVQRMGVRAPRAFLHEFLPLAGGLVAKLLAVLVFFAIVDRIFSSWDFTRNMRMSRREIEDEHKHREGDPRIR